MAFIRKHDKLKTGYQESAPWNELIDFHQDFVMVYGVGNNLKKRLDEYREKGYKVHLMTGSSWGDYDDYYDGTYDGQLHYEVEGQVDEKGEHMDHNKGKIPYMVPVASFCDYLVDKLQKAIDYGVTDFHLEEPEFWSFTGYSEAFKGEYEMYYQEPYISQNASLDQIYKCNKLKQVLYSRCLEYVSWRLKDYGKRKYQKTVNFYVPTHSLLNYSQWGIISPEGNLMKSNYLDGIIAQVWTGTSREPNCYLAQTKERTFETAFLEYGISLELIKGTNKKIWFLNDPIEDNPTYTWDNYKYNYLRTLTASLLHSEVDNFEICPWPNRIFNRKLPEKATKIKYSNVQANIIPAYISADYATFLNNIFNTLGDIEKATEPFYGNNIQVGVFLSDTGMFQRNYPNNLVSEEFRKKGSLTYPDFYGLSLPLLKAGFPLKPLCLEKVVLLADYLTSYQLLVLSYEYIKPESLEMNYCLYRYVQNGGLLLLVDSLQDPYNKISSWWQEAGFQSPSEHLLTLLKDGKNGKGYFKHLKIAPATICFDCQHHQDYLDSIKELLAMQKITYQEQNYLLRRRGNYQVVAVMDEGKTDKLTLNGTYIDLYTNDFQVVSNPVYQPDEVGLLYDPSLCQEFEIIGTTKRVVSCEIKADECLYTLKGLQKINCYLCIKGALARYQVFVDNKQIDFTFNQTTRTILINYQSSSSTTIIKLVRLRKTEKED